MFIFCKNKNTIFLLLQVTTLIQGSNATLMIDGWSNLKNEPVIGVAFMAKGKCYLANTIDTLGTQHTSENLVQIVKEQIEHCESTYKVNITSLVCDNAANMVSMRKQLADDIGLHVFGCNAHYANLLAKDICNSSGGKSVLAKITDIIKYLRNTHSAMSMLRNKNMNQPKMPVETRWNSQCEIVDYFLANWMNIVCIISELLPKNDKLFRYMDTYCLGSLPFGPQISRKSFNTNWNSRGFGLYKIDECRCNAPCYAVSCSGAPIFETFVWFWISKSRASFVVENWSSTRVSGIYCQSCSCNCGWSQ